MDETTIVFEGMTSLSALLKGGHRKIQKVLIDKAKKKSKEKEIHFLEAKSKELGFPIEFVSEEEIDELASGKTHGGILGLCDAYEIPYLCPNDICEKGFYVYLQGMEDPFQFGYTLRSLYACGVDGVILSPRNWMEVAGTVCKSSAGASELLPLFICEENDLEVFFHGKQYQILSAGIRDSVSVYDEIFPMPLLLVVGGEKRGISRELLEKSDKIVRIDYGREFRGSLSTSSSATVLAFEIFRQNRGKQS